MCELLARIRAQLRQRRTRRCPALQLSRKLLSTLDRRGCLSFRSALASICRICAVRSEYRLPTSSKVWSLFMPRPKRMRTMRSAPWISTVAEQGLLSINAQADLISFPPEFIDHLPQMRTNVFGNLKEPVQCRPKSAQLALAYSCRGPRRHRLHQQSVSCPWDLGHCFISPVGPALMCSSHSQ